ncbi:hypothetical protein F4781DRAFT_444549 [Annulohypoxylon bovei var. microspora]|nr:hypothetical protein F4781DRAFT_444549 [Annulohypoxylon bovei var. microspora]
MNSALSEAKKISVEPNNASFNAFEGTFDSSPNRTYYDTSNDESQDSSNTVPDSEKVDSDDDLPDYESDDVYDTASDIKTTNDENDGVPDDLPDYESDVEVNNTSGSEEKESTIVDSGYHSPTRVSETEPAQTEPAEVEPAETEPAEPAETLARKTRVKKIPIKKQAPHDPTSECRIMTRSSTKRKAIEMETAGPMTRARRRRLGIALVKPL